MHALCVSGAVKAQGFVWTFIIFLFLILIKSNQKSNFMRHI